MVMSEKKKIPIIYPDECGIHTHPCSKEYKKKHSEVSTRKQGLSHLPNSAKREGAGLVPRSKPALSAW